MNETLDFTRTMTSQEREYYNVMNSKSLDDFVIRLNNYACSRCELSKRNNKGTVVFKGNTKAQVMLVGEAPGKIEDKLNKAFVGPAGELQDRLFAAVGINTTKDLYLSNCVKCRPTAQPKTGKQNDTPKKDHTSICKPYILKEIELLDPKIIVAVGKTAAVTLFGLGEKTLMKHIVGRFFQNETIPQLHGKDLYVMYHPAAVLHATGEDAEELKRDILEQVKRLKTRINELGIKISGTI